MKIIILILAVSLQKTYSLNNYWTEEYTVKSIGYGVENHLANYLNVYPSYVPCFMGEPENIDKTSKRYKTNEKWFWGAELVRSEKLPNNNNIKILSYLVGKMFLDENQKIDKVIRNFVTNPNEVTNFIKKLQVLGSPFDIDSEQMDILSISIPTKNMPSISKPSSIPKKTNHDTGEEQEWVVNPVDTEHLFSNLLDQGFTPQKFIDKTKLMAASWIEKGNITTFTVIASSNESGVTDDRLSQLYDSWVDLLKLNEYDHLFHTKNEAIDLHNRNDVLQDKCMEAHDNLEFKELSRYRQAFNPFKILSELRLMRLYPNTLYSWLRPGGKYHETFKKDNPNYDAILLYLKTAGNRDIELNCAAREMGAWALAWKHAREFKLTKSKSWKRKLNYRKRIDDDMLFYIPNHMEVSLNLIGQFLWEIEDLPCNDWGSLHLIINHFFKHKDPAVWKWLIKNDHFGYRNLAFASSKYKAEHRVALIWYEKIVDEGTATQNERDLGKITSYNCNEMYSDEFYLRRLKDYDTTNKDGSDRKCGDGECISCCNASEDD